VSTGHDTTSHAFVWHIDTLGAWLSKINDIYCVSENDVWAVGYFYTLGPDGKVHEDSSTNVAHWDGSKWQLLRADPLLPGNIHTFGERYAVFGIGPFDIWVENIHLTGNHWNWQVYDVNVIVHGNFTRIWGDAIHGIFMAGDQGSLIKWDGAEFVEIGKMTNTCNKDIWGWKDTMYVAVTDYDPAGFGGCLIRFVHGREVGRELMYSSLQAVWGTDGAWYASGCVGGGVYRNEGSDWTWQSIPTKRCVVGIRGTGRNNVFIACQGGGLYHFNGSTLAIIRPEDQETWVRSLSATGAAVFFAVSKGNWAVVHRGYRQ
jgi:hypothetical protein